ARSHARCLRSGVPFHHPSQRSARAWEPGMAQTYDAIVIGAGVIGASVAFHLASAGLPRVLIVERHAVCSGNTRKSGAIVRMHYTNAPEARLALASLPYFQDWANRVGRACGLRQTGFA